VTATEPPPLVDEPISARSRYVCRVHYFPTSWRGTGCEACGREERQARRRRKREPATDVNGHSHERTRR
jgi:hypothetical protein